MNFSLSISKERLSDYLKVFLFVVLFWFIGSYVNLPVRNYLKSYFNDVPYWLDHIFFMVFAKVTVAIFLGCLFLKKNEMFLDLKPHKKYIVEGFASSLILASVVGLVLKAMGALVLQYDFNSLLTLGNGFSNFYEEFIYRGVLLGFLVKYSRGNTKVAVMLSALAFLNGHLQYPAPFLGLILISGIYWANLTLRSKSLLPAWISHCCLDLIADTFFRL